jgi:Na+/H+ antiporter NhaD/arsenite permease-like protein
MSLIAWATLVITTATYAGIAVGRWPWLRVDRTTLTLIGAAMLLACGALTLEEAYAALDLDTILLLFSMMILNAYLYLSGFFALVSNRTLRLAKSPRLLLALLICASAILSALFLNDTVVLMLSPIVLDITMKLKRNPIPYLIALATSANIGSVATITGNPQNMIVGTASKISYIDFTLALLPIALVGMLICWLVIVLLYPKEFRNETIAVPDVSRSRPILPLMYKSIAVTLVMLVLFLLGVPVALASFLAAAALLFTRRLKPKRVLNLVDWPILLFFAALFVVTASLETTGITEVLFHYLSPIAAQGLVSFGLITAVISNLISNVPAVLLLQTLIPGFADPNQAWLMLAAASTLAGNFTLLGSVANLIVAEIAGRWGVHLRFGDYFKAGVPITISTLIVAFIWLSL